MNGLQLAELFYTEQCAPMLRRSFPALVPRIAAGLVGEGSECMGFDDAISRDHDWGAGLCLWLNDDDYAQEGERLAKELASLPDTFQGYPVRASHASGAPARSGRSSAAASSAVRMLGCCTVIDSCVV